MASINQVTLIGYLGADPNVITTQNGVKVASISVGTTERGYKTKDGKEVPDRTDWHNVTLWRHSAEFAEKYCKKGAMVYIQGKLKNEKYEKDGQTRYVTKVDAETFELLDRKQNQQEQVLQPTPTQQPTFNGGIPFGNDGMPF